MPTAPGTGNHKPCEVCRRPVVQRDRERIDKWLTRKTCSPECRASLLSRIGAGRTVKRAVVPHPRCPMCDRPVERRARETVWNFGKRKTCGATCHAALRQNRQVTAQAPSSVRDRRKALGISREALARAAGVSATAVASVEHGAECPLARPKILEALARLEAAAGVTVPEDDPGWPERTSTELPAGCFRGHDLPRRAADFRRMDPPATHVETACILGGE